MRAVCITSILILAVAVGALAFRLPLLVERPLHTDEAVHTVKAGELLETGRYVYDPHDYHGPTPYYFALPFIWLGGAHTFADTEEWMYRIVPVLFGVALVLLLLAVGSGLGRGAAVYAAVLTAVSPAMVFYSRYYIQEMILVFATFGVIAFGWRFAQTRRLVWALFAGASAGLMHATKETCILAFASMAGAGVLTLFWAWRRDGEAVAQTLRPAVKAYWKHVAGAALVAAFVSVVFMSGFFTSARGPLDSVLTYTSYLGRAAAGADRVDGASFHDHPWYYYLKMLLYTKDAPGPWWSEALILVLALAGAVIALARRSVDGANRHFVRFLAFYTILLIAAYSLIPYKTPWCALSFLHGSILLAGFGAMAILRAMPHWTLRGVAAVLLAGATVQLSFQAYRASYVYCADTRNPYVYAHTAPDMLKLAKRMEDLAAIDPRGHAMPVYVMTPDADYWPLPWYLRRFDHVGYWDRIPEVLDAPVVVAGAAFDETLATKLQDAYQPEYYGLRPEVLLAVYIKQDLWKAFIDTRR